MIICKHLNSRHIKNKYYFCEVNVTRIPFSKIYENKPYSDYECCIIFQHKRIDNSVYLLIIR